MQEGNISIEDAVKHAQGMGVDMNFDRSTVAGGLALAEGKIYNFGVYKINRLKGAQRRILQLDFQTKTLCHIQKGHRTNQIRFEQIDRVESEDGVSFSVAFSGESRQAITEWGGGRGG